MPERTVVNDDQADIVPISENFEKVDKDITAVEQEAATLGVGLNAHINNRANPHGVTAAQVDAYTKAQVDAQVAVYESHVVSKDNPHDVTPAQIGAYSLAQANESNAARPTKGGSWDANRVVATDGSGSVVTTGATPEEVGYLTGLNANVQQQLDSGKAGLAAHVADVANPHRVTKAQVGLDRVDNTPDADKSVAYADDAGLASAATKLATSRTINGVGFNGTANINIPRMVPVNLTGTTADLNTYCFANGHKNIWLESTTDNGTANITNKPTSAAFTMHVVSPRCNSASDFVTLQRWYTKDYSVWERWCTSNSWTNWVKVSNQGVPVVADDANKLNGQAASYYATATGLNSLKDAALLKADYDTNGDGKVDKAELADSATQLATARTIRTNLASGGTASFNGTANVTPGVSGILPIANGGTGNNAGKVNDSAMLNGQEAGYYATATALAAKANASDVLTKTNATTYTPTASYHPATKKYVDEAVAASSGGGSGNGDMLKSVYDPRGRYADAFSFEDSPTNLLLCSGNYYSNKDISQIGITSRSVWKVESRFGHLHTEVISATAGYQVRIPFAVPVEEGKTYTILARIRAKATNSNDGTFSVAIVDSTGTGASGAGQFSISKSLYGENGFSTVQGLVTAAATLPEAYLRITSTNFTAIGDFCDIEWASCYEGAITTAVWSPSPIDIVDRTDFQALADSPTNMLLCSGNYHSDKDTSRIRITSRNVWKVESLFGYLHAEVLSATTGYQVQIPFEAPVEEGKTYTIMARIRAKATNSSDGTFSVAIVDSTGTAAAGAGKLSISNVLYSSQSFSTVRGEVVASATNSPAYIRITSTEFTAVGDFMDVEWIACYEGSVPAAVWSPAPSDVVDRAEHEALAEKHNNLEAEHTELQKSYNAMLVQFGLIEDFFTRATTHPPLSYESFSYSSDSGIGGPAMDIALIGAQNAFEPAQMQLKISIGRFAGRSSPMTTYVGELDISSAPTLMNNLARKAAITPFCSSSVGRQLTTSLYKYNATGTFRLTSVTIRPNANNLKDITKITVEARVGTEDTTITSDNLFLTLPYNSYNAWYALNKDRG